MKELYVLFRVAGAEYAVPANDVLYLESYTGATKVPGAPAYVAGLVQVRAKVVTVIDLAARFGLEPTKPELGTRVIVVQRGNRAIGLLVDGAREVLRIEEERLKDPPDALTGDAGGMIRRVAQLDQRLLMLLDLERVIGAHLEGGQHGEQRN